MKKMLKIKVGEIFLDGKTIPVFQIAWQQKSKVGKTYWEIRSPVFTQEYQEKVEEQEVKNEGGL